MNEITLACMCLNKIVPLVFIGAFQFTSELHSVRLYQSPGGLYFLVMVAEIVYLLFIVYYMFLQVHTNTTTTYVLTAPFIAWLFVIHVPI